MSAPLVIRGSAHYPVPSARPVVTIGNFDGVHQGHRALIHAATERATALGVPSCVYTFDPAPRDVLRPGNPIVRIQSLEAKIALLGECGVEQVIVEPFTRAFGAHGGEWFATEVLGTRIGASAVVVGWDFRFGAGRAGTADALREWLSVPITQVDAVEQADGVISSSRIREALKSGAVEEAARLLLRPHITSGTVISGHGRGRTLGIRTANLSPTAGIVPAVGVYAIRARDDAGNEWGGVANIGHRPTFPGAGGAIEAHLFDVDADLYGETLHIAWLTRLRDEQLFESPDALVTQIRQDITAARAYLG